MIIAIDGPAGSGKSTIAKLVAKKLNFLYIDTGAMYRAVTLKGIMNNIDFCNKDEVIKLAENSKIELENINGSLKVFLDNTDVSLRIRYPDITKYVSDVAKIEGVRKILSKLQREIASGKDVILDGRDIGTVIFPNAEKKFFLDADFKERANRRFLELKDSNTITVNDVENDLKNRDAIDSTREVAPLKKADDAIYIDTTNMTIHEVVDKVLEYIGAG
ncbi:MAG: (d)CMP kinase [Candidatus Omnitrophota bacterium]